MIGPQLIANAIVDHFNKYAFYYWMAIALVAAVLYFWVES